MFTICVIAGFLAGPGPRLDADGIPLPDGAVRRFGSARLRHAANIHHIAFSPDDTKIASIAPGEYVRVWEAKTGRLLYKFGPTETARLRDTVAFPDDRTVVALLDGGVLVRFDVTTGQDALRVKPPAAATCHDYWISPDGKRVLVNVDWQNGVEYDGETGAYRAKIGQLPGSQFTEARSHDGTMRAVGTAAGTILLMKAGTWDLLPQSPDPPFTLSHLHFTDRGRTLVGLSWVRPYTPIPERLLGWDVSSGNTVAIVPPGTNSSGPISVSPDGGFFVTREAQGELTVSDRATGRPRYHLNPEGVVEKLRARAGIHGNFFQSYLLTPDGRRLVGWSSRNGVKVFDTSSGRRSAGPDDRHTFYPATVSADGSHMAGVIQTMSGPRCVVLRDWDSERTTVVNTIPFPERPRALALTPDGRLLAADVSHTGFDVWDVATGVKRQGFAQRLGAVTGPFAEIKTPPAVFSPDGSMLAVGSMDGLVRLWETATGSERVAFEHARGVTGLAFSPDGRLVAAASPDAPVYLWDVYGIHTLPGQPLSPAAWSDLAAADARTAFTAVRRLVASPAASVGLLREQLKLTATADLTQIRKRVQDLDSPAFAIREAASNDLTNAGDVAEPLLREALAGSSSAEVRDRVERLLTTIARRSLSPATTRERRAVEVLEAIGTADARDLLGEYAVGAEGARLTREAKAALVRLNLRR